MSDLPWDIWIDILSRLPAKSLGKLKSVCKAWFSLISSQTFVKFHHYRAISDPNSNHFRLFIISTFSLHSVDYKSSLCYESVDDAKAVVALKDPLTEETGQRLMGSCYGLVYFVCFQDCIILWNPCTRQTRRIPNPSTSSPNTLSFYGLGYDFSIDDYKMVRATRYDSGKFTKTVVFDLKSESWRTIETFPNDIKISEEEIGMFSSGALHWQGRRGTGSSERDIILSLNMEEEKFGEIPLPNVGDKKLEFSWLGDLKGSLYTVSGGVFYESDVDIWVMKEYGVEKSWTKLLSLSFSAFDCSNSLMPVCFIKEDDVVLDLDGWNLVRFNSSEKTIKTFKKWSTDWHDWLLYVECLVSPYG